MKFIKTGHKSGINGFVRIAAVTETKLIDSCKNRINIVREILNHAVRIIIRIRPIGKISVINNCNIIRYVTVIKFFGVIGNIILDN